MKTKLLLLLAFICQISFTQVSDANLVAYYSFDNTLVNAGPGGSNYNLSYFGTGTNPTYLATGGVTGGSINNPGCFEFNTTITLQNSEFFNLLDSTNPNQSISVSYWVYNNQAQNSGSIRTHFEMFGSLFARGGLGWGVSTQNGNFNTTSDNVAFTSGVWNHITLVFDASVRRLRMYVNGFAYSEVVTPANSIFKYNNKFVIGGGTDGSGENSLTKAISGRIDEMYVFNRALRAFEVIELYNKQVPTNNCPTGSYSATTQAQVDALAGCTTINGDLTINAPNLTYLNSLSSLTTVNGNLTIANCTNLTNLEGLSNLTTVTGNLVIGGTSISNLNPLTSLTTFNSIVLNGNNSLTDIQTLSNISGSLTGNITIINNQNLTNLNGLQNITQATNLNISNNASLQSINGLSGLTTLTNSFSNTLTIENNPLLVSLNGLNNLVNLPNNGGVRIISNTSLTDIGALATISNLAYLEIINNTNLSTCAIAPVCNLLNVNTSNAFISGNGTNCSSKTVVQNICDTLANPCPSGNVTFLTQAEVDTFVAQYPNCTIINGNLNIGPVSSGTSSITNISGLSNLTQVNGELSIRSNQNLTNLTGLNNITSVGTILRLEFNPVLINLDGLSGIVNIGESILIGINTGLQNLNGLSGITQLPNGYLYVNNNPQLTSLQGLHNITTIGESMWITACNGLTNLNGLSGLTTFSNNSSEYIYIMNNANLASLSGLQNITSLGNRSITIQNNSALSDISALNQIVSSTIGSLGISNHPNLALCNVPWVCSYISNASVVANFHSNATGCESRAVVQAACDVLSSSNFELESNLKIYPNPFNSQITIDLGNFYENTTIIIHDTIGKQIYQNSFSGNQLVINNLSSLPSGMYIATLTTENGTSITKKIIK
jgi:hypothetical protein